MISLKNILNETASKEAMGIAGFTGTRAIAVQKFIDDFNLNAKKLFNFIAKGKLKDRMDFATAISGTSGNKYQGNFVGMFGEGTINEDSETKRLEMLIKNLEETIKLLVQQLKDNKSLPSNKKENIKSLVLAIDNVAGPQAYNIAKDAEVTVVLYNKRTVKANYAFRKGELNEKAVEAIVKDIPKILEKDEKK